MQSTANNIKHMQAARQRSAPLLGLLLGVAGVPWLLTTAWAPATAAVSGVPVSPADALLGGAALGAAVGTAWLVLGIAFELLARAPGTLGRTSARVSAAVTPRLVRRAVGIAVGMGMGAGVASSPSPAASVRAVPAVVQESLADAPVTNGPRATPGADRLPDPGWSPAPDPGWSPPPDHGWTPTAPVVRPQPDVSAVSPAGRRPAGADHAEVVVRRGDSLWTIAAHHLGPGATDAEVAAEWPRWYAANRAVIGPDPDLLLPGQVLRAPEEPR